MADPLAPVASSTPPPLPARQVTVLGAGAWGTALALVLSRQGHRVSLWGHHPGHLGDMRQDRMNQRYLPGIPLPGDWRLESDLDAAMEGAGAVVMAVPSTAFRGLAARLGRFQPALVISVTKGIEYDTGLTMCGVLRQSLPEASQVAALSGPSLALEVARGIPTAVVAGSRDLAAARTTQELFNGGTFRVYASPDELGVELGGALKNVVAIAAGVCDGLGFGANSKAALLTRGIVEIRRLGVACGAQAESFAGLSGLGDLTVTCFSPLSRNRRFGERLGRGESVGRVLAGDVSVAEGHPTARSAWRLARERGVETPIIDQVHAILYEGRHPAQAVQALMNREPKVE